MRITFWSVMEDILVGFFFVVVYLVTLSFTPLHVDWASFLVAAVSFWAVFLWGGHPTGWLKVLCRH